MAAAAGDLVTVGAPFNATYPGQYIVQAIDSTGSVVLPDGTSFDQSYITVVQAGAAPAVASPPMLISKLAFRQRFTAEEQQAIYIAASDMPTDTPAQRAQQAQLRIGLDDIQAASVVNLNDSLTQQFVQALEAATLIATGRAAQILTTPISAAEAPST